MCTCVENGPAKVTFWYFCQASPGLGTISSFIYRYSMCSVPHSNHDPGEPHTGVKEIIQAGDWARERPEGAKFFVNGVEHHSY